PAVLSSFDCRRDRTGLQTVGPAGACQRSPRAIPTAVTRDQPAGPVIPRDVAAAVVAVRVGLSTVGDVRGRDRRARRTRTTSGAGVHSGPPASAGTNHA